MLNAVNAAHALCCTASRGFHQLSELVDSVSEVGVSVPLLDLVAVAEISIHFMRFRRNSKRVVGGLTL